MATARDRERAVLSAILPDRLDLLERAIAQLTLEHFDPNGIHQGLFRLLIFVYERNHALATQQQLSDAIGRDTTSSHIKSKLLAFREEFDLLAAKETSEADFLWNIDEIKNSVAEQATLDAINEGMTIARHGVVDKRGEEFRGHQAARAKVVERFAEIDKQLNTEESPEGDIRVEGDDFLKEYEKQKQQKASGQFRGVLSGVTCIDDVVGGLQPGELDLMIGFSASGKSTMCVQIAHQACVRQGKNVAFFTTETLRPQISRKVIARHSNETQFGLEVGLDTKKIRDGLLSAGEEAILEKVVRDFGSNKDYGIFHLAQVPHGATISSIYASAQLLARRFPVDLLVIDYLALLSSGSKRQTSREEYNDTIKQAKRMATTFDNGKGVPVVSPWQTSREAHDKAVMSGYYTLSALSETSEATNSADVIISLMEPREPTGRHALLKGQVLKDREGAQTQGLEITVDYASSYFTSGSSNQDFGMTSLLG